MKSHKYTVLSVLTFLIFLALFFILRPYIYKVIPPKQVEINKEFAIGKWQTVKFGEDKYVTGCGTTGNAVAGTGPYPAYILKVKGIVYPCTHNPLELFNGPTKPYSVVFKQFGSPSIIVIKNSLQYYNEWADGFLENNCGAENLSPQQKRDCLRDNLINIGDPNICSRQTAISIKECINDYIDVFKKHICTPPYTSKSEENILFKTFENQDDCLIQEIKSRHLPSENCDILIDNKAKATQCFNERKSDENYLESLRG